MPLKAKRDGRLLGISGPSRAWAVRLRRLDPIGPLVLVHAVALTLFAGTEHPVGVVGLAGALYGWRMVLGWIAKETERARQQRMYLIRAIGSLLLMGGVVAFDAGTESPIFFSMVILVVWEAVLTPIPQLVVVGIVAVVTVAAVILTSSVTPASLVRLGVFVIFMLLLTWARGLSELWQLESARARALAATIAETAPIGLALYRSPTLKCLFANEIASQHGLDTPNETKIWRYGDSSAPGSIRDLLAEVIASGKPLPPTLFAAGPDPGEQVFLRVGATVQPVVDQDDLVMVYSEDVTSQVAVEEQQRRFLESANHQFRTPLSPILAYGELIADGRLEATELREAGVTIRDAGQRIQHLLDRLGDLLRLREDFTGRYDSVTVRDLVSDHLLGNDPDLESLLTIQGDLGLIVRCDPRILAAALRELIDNGVRHGIPPVVLSVSSEGDRVELRLWDQGQGPDIDAAASLDQPWSILESAELMPPNMGQRLGIAFAHTLSRTAGASLAFERDSTRWSYVFHLAAAAPQTAKPPRQHI